MVNSLKRLNWIQIVSLVLLVVAYILHFFNIKSIREFFWVALAINMVGFLIFVIKWSREGKTGIKKADKNYNKNLTRKASDYIFLLLVAYYLIVCGVIIIGFFYDNYMYDSGTLLSMLSVAFVCNFTALLVVERTSQEIKVLLKGGKKNGSK